MTSTGQSPDSNHVLGKRGYSPFDFGLAFFLLWWVLWTALMAMRECSLPTLLVSSITFIVTSALLAAVLRKRRAFVAKSTLNVIACLCALATSIVCALADPLHLPRLAYVVVSPCAGCASALYCLQWCCRYAHETPRRSGVCYCVSFLVAGVCAFVLLWCPDAVLLIVLAVLPPLCSASYVRVVSKLPERDRGIGDEGRARVVPWRHVALAVAYSATFFFALVPLDGLQWFAGIGPAVVGLLGFLGGELVYKRLPQQLFETIALFFTSAGVLLLLLFGVETAVASNAFLSIGLSSFVVYMLCLMNHMVYHQDMASVTMHAVVGIALAVSACAALAVRDVLGWELAAQAIVPETRVIIACCLLATIMLSVMFFNRASMAEHLMGSRAHKSHGGKSQARGLPLSMSSQEALVWRCKKVALKYELTPREEELLALLVRGMDNRDIERELHLSNNTVRTHLRHIYAKTGTHGREGVLKLVDTAV